MKRKKLSGLSALVGLLWMTAANAAVIHQYTYQVVGDELVRGTSNESLDVADLTDGKSPTVWRPVFSLSADDLAAGKRVEKLVCDPHDANLCFVAVGAGGSDRRSWLPISLRPSPRPSQGTALRDSPAEIVDVAAEANAVLLMVDPSTSSDAAGLSSGFYLVRHGQNPLKLSDLAPSDGVNWARFLRTGASEPNIVIFRGGESGSWGVVGPDRSHGVAQPWPGEPRAIDGDAVLFATPAEGPAGGLRLEQMQFPQNLSGAWSPRPLVAANTQGQSFSIAPLSSTKFPGDVVVVAGTEIYAVTLAGDGQSLTAFCGTQDGRAGHADERFKRELAGSAVLFITGGEGAHAIVTSVDASGFAHPFLLTDRGGCESSSATLTPLPSSDAPESPSPPVTVYRRSVAASDGETIPYVVIGNSPAALGGILLRVYGQNGRPTLAVPATPFEKAWLQKGGRLVVPTVRGDFRQPPWKSNPIGDYKARASQDVIAVANDLIARGETRAGQITIFGASAGAFTAAKTALSRPDLFNAVILVSGDLDLQSATPHNQALVGSPAGGPEAWFGGRPSAACAESFLIYHGSNDALVGQSASLSFGKYLKTLGYSGLIRLFPGFGHGLDATDAFSNAATQDLADLTQQNAKCLRR